MNKVRKVYECVMKSKDRQAVALLVNHNPKSIGLFDNAQLLKTVVYTLSLLLSGAS